MAKISERKVIPCELLRLHFKRKNNNIKRKRLWAWKIFIEKNRKKMLMLLLLLLLLLLILLLLLLLFAIAGCNGINFPSLNTCNVNWLLLDILILYNEVLQLWNNKKISSSWERSYFVLSRCACAKSKNFPFQGKLSEVHLSLSLAFLFLRENYTTFKIK